MTDQKRNAFPHLKWKLQYIYWNNNITFMLLTKRHLTMTEGYFDFCLWFSEKWLRGALGKLFISTRVCLIWRKFISVVGTQNLCRH